MNTRFFPGMLAPRYQEDAFEKRVSSASSAVWSLQAPSASAVGSMVVAPVARRWGRESVVLSACCSMEIG